MSRTKRKILKQDYNESFVIEAGDTFVSPRAPRDRKMKPYAVGPNVYKYVADKTDHVGGLSKGVSRYDKLVTKNANRGQKKAFRQHLKNELRESMGYND